MTRTEIAQFRIKLNNDPENQNLRREFHENYELLEAYWKAKFQKGNGDEMFANKFNQYYWSLIDVQNIAKEFSLLRPVGSSSFNFIPTPNLNKATFHLKYYANYNDPLCIETNEQEKEQGKDWKSGSFQALLTIVTQVRNNLFHGGKIQLEDEQYNRNKTLVMLSRNLTDILLLKLEEEEDCG